MIATIDAQLCVWGKWQIRIERRAVGYPPFSPMFRDTPSAKGNGGNPVKGITMTARSDMADISAAVRTLSVEHRRLVAETYVVGGNRNAVALRMGIARQRYYEQLGLVHQRVQAALHEMAIGA